MSESAAARLGPTALASVVDAAPDGVAVFDGDWTIRYVNPAGAGLLQRSASELVDRNIWIALPELGGTIFHGFLLHARSVDSSVSWQGYYAPAGRWLSATAAREGDLARVRISQPAQRPRGRAPPP